MGEGRQGCRVQAIATPAKRVLNRTYQQRVRIVRAQVAEDALKLRDRVVVSKGEGRA